MACVFFSFSLVKIFYDGGPYHMETSLLICFANKWTGFYMIVTSVIKEFKQTDNNDNDNLNDS